jgi:hypothetical protein
MRGDGSTLRILGPVELTGPAGPVRLGAAKERCLPAVFALHLGEAMQWERPERVAHDLDALLRKGNRYRHRTSWRPSSRGKTAS